MPRMLSELAAGISCLDRRGPAEAEIAGLAYDSRAVGPGFLFFALPGLHSDGQSFIGAAVQTGAAAVVHRDELPSYAPGVAYLRVADPRFAMSPIAAEFYGRPSRSLGVIGVTGTEGKSTTVYLIYQLLNLAGRKAGFFSTVMSDTGSGERPNPEHQTTPEATAVQRMLAAMRDSGCEFAVVESSSHGLSPRTNRLGDVAFDAGVFMNVTSEHLEFHGSWERYRDDKANLFRALDKASHAKTIGGLSRELPAFGVACLDDDSAPYFAAATSKPTFFFSSKGRTPPSGPPGFLATGIRSDERGATFSIESGGERAEARIELPGAFNVDNALAALAAASGITGVPWKDFLPLLPKLKPVRGRMTRIDRGQSFELLVDYAHTPSSFLTVFPPLRERVTGKMICVFGSGGERDTEKRPRQGRIAADWFDVVILADEDPRGEDPAELLEQIAAGCPELPRGERLFIIPDRPSAIRKAFSLAGKGDLVALLGKGHENSIIYKDGPIPYDEIGEAEKALAELGYR
ncbi:MAG TPA: UDP-N-acetylmuramoyl-L-alanyl-D-glutamate--2,6-diaminopimelate ligase [Spirochaetia bacterium]|nr:UDP-N-acetylmuramoyl-L-alanyl-D-glutamate--2,6-diaminopimelate ligase [Spirochaetia bacterium]